MNEGGRKWEGGSERGKCREGRRARVSEEGKVGSREQGG